MKSVIGVVVVLKVVRLPAVARERRNVDDVAPCTVLAPAVEAANVSRVCVVPICPSWPDDVMMIATNAEALAPSDSLVPAVVALNARSDELAPYTNAVTTPFVVTVRTNGVACTPGTDPGYPPGKSWSALVPNVFRVPAVARANEYVEAVAPSLVTVPAVVLASV
jgi:hypothetical protein